MLVANVLTALQALDICVSYEVCVYPRCACVWERGTLAKLVFESR